METCKCTSVTKQIKLCAEQEPLKAPSLVYAWASCLAQLLVATNCIIGASSSTIYCWCGLQEHCRPHDLFTPLSGIRQGSSVMFGAAGVLSMIRVVTFPVCPHE